MSTMLVVPAKRARNDNFAYRQMAIKRMRLQSSGKRWVCPEGYYSITSLTVMAHKLFNSQEFFHKIQLVVNINSCNLQN